ncbi:DUF2335 domain-containing protein [Acinetobacter bereziniae]|uniref:DUF2335 domain-containing protein n=1 Tax=Acinetobacter bereziniae TaxID=106648 RepID=UPI002253A029|nr:DUF2335 domain-containing protein [Acinetobacter bereziniae]
MSISDNSNLPSESVENAVNPKEESEAELVEHEVKVERIVKEAAVKAAFLVKQESFRGPLPKPDHLKAYDEICPGAAQDIMNEFKANGQHVRTCESKALDASIAKVQRGQWLAVFLALVCLGLAVLCVAYFNAHWVAGLLVVLTGTLVVPFLGFNPKSSKNEEDDSTNE